MTAFQSAAIVAAATAFVLANVDPRPLNNPCRRHPDTAGIDGHCIDCARDEAHTEHARRTRAEAELFTRVRTALGLPGHGRPVRETGETATRVCVWDQVDLNTVYERVGGTVTARTTHRTTDSGRTVWDATEITVTVDLPGVGTVQVFTDWYETAGGRDLPLMQAIPDAILIAQ